jgi:hypothetical protein
MKQTAVEYLNEQMRLNSKFKENSKGGISFKIGLSKIDELFRQAKDIEREQIVDAYETSHISMMNAEQYYNENFKINRL